MPESTQLHRYYQFPVPLVLFQSLILKSFQYSDQHFLHVTMVNPLSWDALAAISASVAAIVAAFQLQLSRIDSNKRLAISLLRDFTAILEKLNLYDIKVVAASVTASYEQGVPLTQEGSVYIALIHSLEFLAHAYFSGGIDTETVDQFLRGLLKQQDTVSIDFLEGLQREQGNDEAYAWSIKLIRRYALQASSRSRANVRLTQVRSIFHRWATSVHRGRRSRLRQDSHKPSRHKTSKP